MYLLTINLYELGQFLRIVLWIFLPMAILSMLITTWFHYRRKASGEGQLLLSVEGFDPGRGPDRLEDMPVIGEPEGLRNMPAMGESSTGAATSTVDKTVVESTVDKPVMEDPVESLLPDEEWKEGNDNIYRGIMWMKEKYEQYRELTDKRYEQLREQLNRSELRYQGVLLELEESRNHALEITTNPGQDRLAEGMSVGEAAKQVIIEELEEQLRVERLKVEELVVKLQNNSQLLLNIYQELDKSFGDISVPATPAVAGSATSGPIPAMPVSTPAATQP